MTIISHAFMRFSGATPYRSMPFAYPINSSPKQIMATRFRFISWLFFALSSLGYAFPRAGRVHALPRRSVSHLCISVTVLSLIFHLRSMLCHFKTSHRYSNAIRNCSYAYHRNSIPSLCFTAIGFAFSILFLCYSKQTYATSSHLKRPFPAFLH